MGLIHRWAGMASHAPWLANLVLRTPGVANLAKSVGGIAQARKIPPFASPTFRQWHAKNAKRNGGERVILWPDTFNNYFRADTAVAATRLLERLGFQVEIPSRVLCCGRPLYDWGWIDQAKALWRETLGVLRNGIDAGVPVIGLEPACTSAFRDELPALFPNDPLATALSKQTRFLSEFLTERGITPPISTRSPKALVQLHCHHHAVLDEDAERKLLDALPLDCEVLNTGCCGMAGSFGFEAEKYDISLTIAEKGMLPKIRSCSRDTLIVANGFSCREQIEQLTGRKTLHLAQLLQVQA